MSTSGIRHEGWLTFVETASFTRDWNRLGLTEDDLAALQTAIVAAPTLYPVIKGTGSLRKIRFAARGSDRGKSGGNRACYVAFLRHGAVYLIAVFDKTTKADLTPAERDAIAAFIRRTERALDTLEGG